MTLSLTATLSILGASAFVIAIAQVRERRKYVPGRPSLIPWIPLQFVAILVAILMIAHLVTFVTGQPLEGRLVR